MSTPIIETIAEKIATLIDGVTAAAGYNQTLTAVRPKRIHLEGDLNADNTVIIDQEDAAIEQDSNTELVWRQGFSLQALVIDSDDAAEAIDTRLNKIAADMIKHLFLGDNWQLDGNADGILIKGTQRFIADPQLSGVALNIDVIYRTAASDPYTKS
jgi:hypothetical protein